MNNLLYTPSIKQLAVIVAQGSALVPEEVPRERM